MQDPEKFSCYTKKKKNNMAINQDEETKSSALGVRSC